MAFDLDEKIDVLRALGFDTIKHSGGMLIDHFLATYLTLLSWKCSGTLCDAGLFHSVYGTAANGVVRVPSAPERAAIVHVIGESAEALVFFYCVLDRDRFYHSILERESEPEIYFLPDVKPALSANEGDMAPPSVSDLSHLIAANWLDHCRRQPELYAEAFVPLIAGLSPWLSDGAAHHLRELWHARRSKCN